MGIASGKGRAEGGRRITTAGPPVRHRRGLASGNAAKPERAETRAFLAPLRRLLSVHPLTGETHEMGLALAEHYLLSTWDAMIVASALEAGCDVLWTEDLQDGMEVAGGLRVRSPFG
ncbi:MAG: PIN domain-containing protein [Beijerinckiaceae bacterium]